MEMIPDPRTSPANLTADTVRAWFLELTAVEQRIGPRFAGIPPERAFTTKPALARGMLEQALQAGVAARWVTGDSVYGENRRLRMWLEEDAHTYVLAVSGKEYVWLGWQQQQVTTVLTALPTDGWTRHSAGAGATGPRWYDWDWLPLAAPR